MSDAEPAVRLEAERARVATVVEDLSRELGALAGSTADRPDDEHDAEGSTIGYERARVRALLAHAERTLADLGVAAQRVVGGTYQWCESCGRHIPETRLAARPTTRACIDCATLGQRSRSLGFSRSEPPGEPIRWSGCVEPPS